MTLLAATQQSTAERRRALFEEAVEVIQREYARDLSLDEVAHRIAASRRQLQRAFAEAGDTTFRACLQEVRMARAAELLRSGTMPVNRVASAVGYRQPAQFAKAFRRHYGKPPSAVRSTAAPLAA
jgi:AraC family transcriptional regulator, regulatory protein of adaptative response / methylphosphotriester-DNA alkyltransferase methyltransferase